MKYKINKNGQTVKESEGSYVDNLKEIHDYAPCDVEQETDVEDAEHNRTNNIHVTPPSKPFIAPLMLLIVLLGLPLCSCQNKGVERPYDVLDLSTGQYCEDTAVVDTVIDLEAEWNEVSKLAHAFAVVESNDNPHAINRKENAVGLLQIRPIMIRQANQIVGEDIYTLSDRHDSIMSIAIFHTVMSELNPTLDIDRAIEIWNPNATQSYRNLIKAIYKTTKTTKKS